MVATVFGLDNKVSVSGDTMTGNLTVPSVSITHQLNANSGFETGLAPWVPGAGTPSQSATHAYQGTFSAKVVPDGVSTLAYIASELMACTVGQSLTVTGWVFAPIGIAAPYAFSLSVSWYDVNQMFLSTSSQFAAVPAGVWTPVTATYIVPAGAAFAQIAPSENGTPPATQFYFVDEVRIAQTSLVQVDQVITSALQIPVQGASGWVLTADAAGNLTPQPSAVTLPAVLSAGSSSQSIVIVRNTTAAPTEPALQTASKVAADQALGVQVTGDTAQRLLIDSNGRHAWGTGAGATDTTLSRAAAGTLATAGAFATGTNAIIGAAASLGDNGVGQIQLADAATIPTTNPAGGVDIYAASGTAAPLKIRDTHGAVRSLADAVTLLAANSAAITTTAQTAVTALAVPVEASATYLMEAVHLINSTVATGDSATYSWTGPTGATMQWGDTNTTSDYVIALGGIGGNGDVTLNVGVHLLVLKGVLATSTTAGTLTPTFGVSSTTGSPSYTVLAGSYVRLTRIK